VLQAAIHQELGNLSETQILYRQLIAIVPDNYKYHYGLCTALELPSSTSQVPPEVLVRLKQVYAELQQKHPRCAACKRIALDFLYGNEFTAAAKAHIRSFVDRGVPSLFSDLKPLVQQPAKDPLLWAAACEVLKDVREGSTEAMWVHLYLAQHAATLQRISAAIEHITAAESSEKLNGIALDVFSAKADVLAAAGDVEGAAVAAEMARLLDLKDRYVNSMATKYWFRAGDVERAKRTALLFAVDFDGSASNLNEMQVIWYELESGHAHAAKGDLGMVCLWDKLVRGRPSALGSNITF
jgi:N-alpha-acetyltransferase 15/16, NatA auxiliary subunit